MGPLGIEGKASVVLGRRREEDSASQEPLPIFGFPQAGQHSLEALWAPIPENNARLGSWGRERAATPPGLSSLGLVACKGSQEERKLQLLGFLGFGPAPSGAPTLAIPRLQCEGPQEGGGPLTLLLAACWITGEWS